MKVQFIVRANNGCDYHRLVVPMEYMQFQSDDNFEMRFIQEDEGLGFGHCDVIYFNRYIHTNAKDLVKLREHTGVKIVVDIDDYWELYPAHHLQSNWYKHQINQKIKENIKIADLVTTTNKQLAAKVSEVNPNVRIIPNALPFGKDQYTDDRIITDKTRFLYAGGLSHQKDIELLEGKFRRIGSDSFIKSNTEFILAGYNSSYGAVDIWNRMKNIFEHTKSSRILPSLDLDNYMDHYKEADVVLIPLVNNEFNNCKSILKILEASAKKLPCIVSAVYPYLELKGVPGIMWVEKPADWIEHIKFCIKNPEKVVKMGEELYKHMSTFYNLDYWNKQRYQALKSLVTVPVQL